LLTPAYIAGCSFAAALSRKVSVSGRKGLFFSLEKINTFEAGKRMQRQYRTSNIYKNHQDVVRRLVAEEQSARERIEQVRQATEEAIRQAETQARQLLAAARSDAERKALELEEQARQAASGKKPGPSAINAEEQPLDINLLHERAEQNMEQAVRLLFDRVSGREKRKR
jgi:vacuolar-type H+-ATPase subunit H